MFSLLNASTNFFESYGFILILLVALVIMFIFGSMKNRDSAKQRINFLNILKAGDKVKTYSGFYGTVEKIIDINEDKVAGKAVLLKIGESKNVSYIWMDANAIYALDTKTEVQAAEQKSEAAVADQGVTVGVVTADAESAKRGRGRPRKVLTPEEIAKAEESHKRGRGRPRKEVKTEEVKVEEIKK